MSTINRSTGIGLLVITVGLSGCAATGLHKAPQDLSSIDPNKAIVIFSFMTRESVDEQSLELSWLDENGVFQFSSVKHKPSNDPAHVFALEISGNRLDLKAMKIKIGREWWHTTEQKELELVTGRVTYIGRIEIQDIRLVDGFAMDVNRMTGGRDEASEPSSVRLGFSDQRESDLASLKTKYSLLDEQAVVMQIPHEWGGDTFVALTAGQEDKPVYRSSYRSPGAGKIFLELLGVFFSGAPPIGF